jgi:L-alanine-DL-glutamate epimerase-like enolase superfamily enzyme
MLTATRIESAEVLRLAIPLRVNFRHALARRSVGDSVVVRLRGERDTVGHGECAPRDYVTGEDAASVVATLDRLVPRFVGQSFATMADTAKALTDVGRGLARDEHAAFCALELAVLDLVGRTLGCSAGDALGPVVAPEVVYSGVVSADDADTVRAWCERMRPLGLRHVKVKVGGTAAADRDALHAVRDVLGADVVLRVDANCAWTAAEALARLRELAAFGLAGAEQPVAADDVGGMAWLATRSPVPIIADESLVSVADAERLAAAHACHVFNVRISKCGGLLSSKRIQEVAARAGIATMLGAQVGETSLLSAAGRHFATRVADVKYCEGSFGELLLERDVAARPIVFGAGGAAAAITAPGLGVDVDDAHLRAFAAPPAA